MVWVIIERRVAEGMVDSFQEEVRRYRREATRRGGYVSGEILREVGDPHHVVTISTWESRDDWEEWASSEERRAVLARIGPMLEEPERFTVLAPTT